MFVLSYQGPNFTNVRAVAVEDEAQADQVVAALGEGSCGLRITLDADSADLKPLSGPVIVKLYNALAETPVKKFDDLASARARLVAATKSAAVPVTPEMLLAPSAEEADTDTALLNKIDEALDNSTQTEEAPVASKAKKTKAKKAPKAAKAPKEKKVKAAKAPKEPRVPGEMRPGTKKAELLRLCSRKTGASLAEMMEATGWTTPSACLANAKRAADATKATMRIVKEKGKESRWVIE